jgi:hypothetical protein
MNVDEEGKEYPPPKKKAAIQEVGLWKISEKKCKIMTQI